LLWVYGTALFECLCYFHPYQTQDTRTKCQAFPHTLHTLDPRDCVIKRKVRPDFWTSFPANRTSLPPTVVTASIYATIVPIIGVVWARNRTTITITITGGGATEFRRYTGTPPEKEE